MATATVSDKQGKMYRLGASLGQGAQGEVFAVDGAADLVIKRFTAKVLTDDTDGKLRRKIAALQAKRLDTKLPQAAWPRFGVYTGPQQWCGYAMRRVEGLPLHPAGILNPRRLEKRYPGICRPELAALALQFLRAIEFLQSEGVKIGDYNHNNFRYDPGCRELGFIDTDAFQVRHEGSMYVCPVTAAELTPPEYLNDLVKWRWRNPENELFSAAIITFLILMPGKHPFETLQADECTENLARPDGFPYRPASGSAGPSSGLVPQGIWERVWYDWPLSLQERFTAIFLTGHSEPKRRGTIAELRQAVEEYAAGFRQGKHFLMPLLGAPPLGKKVAAAWRQRPPARAAPAVPATLPPAVAGQTLPGLVKAHAREVGRLLLRLLIW